MPAGRPSKYKPEYCEELIKHMAGGNSFWSFASNADVHFDTLSEWCSAHPEFSEAKKIGMAKLMAFDEKIAMAGSTGQLKRHSRTITTTDTLPDGTITTHKEDIFDAATFSQTYQIFLMKNRYPRFYRDKIQVETSTAESDAQKTSKVLQEIMKEPELAEAARIIAEKLSEE